MASSIRVDERILRIIMMVACVWVTSMFYFPFEFNALLGINTKMMLAALALVLLLWKMAIQRDFKMDKDFLVISIFAGLVSMCGLFSVTYNNTDDYAYATYLTSAWVWWGAAYTACQFIKWIHGRLTAELIVYYLVAVSVMQCTIALAIDLNPAFKQWVMSIFATGDMYFKHGNVQRMFGIGCALDVAGIRFALVLVAMMFMKMQREASKWYVDLLFYLMFFYIAVVGNMIGRTALVGLGVGFAYLAFVSLRQLRRIESRYLAMWKRVLLILAIFVPIVVFLYQSNPQLRKNFRFGFEGFVNLIEKGEWKVSSNETLKSMYVWPDNAKTWAIGDAYFTNPIHTDPYYTGKITGGYYMGSDVGYVRFIFYFGLIGLVMFSIYMLKVGAVCMRKLPQWKTLFLLFLVVHFIVWFKVATDTFLIFALFLCLDNVNVNENENQNEKQNQNANAYQNENENAVVLAPITG